MTLLNRTNRLKLAYKLGATFKYQQDIVACQEKYRTVVKPRQAGMTTAFAIEGLIDSLIYDNYVICIVSPTERQSGRMMRYIKKAFRKLERELDTLIETEKWTNERVFFHHGSEIHSLPNNPTGIQGLDVNHAIIDEAGLFKRSEGDEVIDAIVGSLAAKKGRLTVSGKPKGKRGLLWQYWDPNNPKSKPFTHFTVTWKDRAKEDPSYGKEVEKHRAIFSKLQFDEVYNAKFIDEGVLIFPHNLLEQANKLWESKRYVLMPADGTPSNSKPKYVGIDFGKKRSLTEIHVLQKEDEGKILRTLMMKTLKHMNFELQKSYIDDLIRRIKPSKVEIDEGGMGLPLLDYFVSKHGNMIQPLKFKELKTKEKTVIQCRNAFEDLRLAIPFEEKLYEQLHSFQKEYTDAGNVRYFGKVDETDFLDDKVVALVAAVDAAQSTPFGFKIV